MLGYMSTGALDLDAQSYASIGGYYNFFAVYLACRPLPQPSS
jgi:hypothetical protein